MAEKPKRPDPLDLLLVHWIGHGRALELYISFTVGLYACLLLISPQGAWGSSATKDLVWLGYAYVPTIAFSVTFFLMFGGLLANINAWPGSRGLRIAGAACCCTLCFWYIGKLIVIGDETASGFPFFVSTLLASTRIMALAIAGRPRPGAPGVWL